ncbi:MAG: peroxiredoxin [Gammaproteobacteria bacterium]
MNKIVVGKTVPKFKLPATGDQILSLSDCRNQNVVLYFYPRDNTSGCTLEAQSFSAGITKFKRLNTRVLGVSRDSLKSHADFRVKNALKFDLLSDEQEKVCRLFGVIKQKSLYGRKFLGIERSTFLIDAKGVLRREWRKVRVSGHVDEVLDAVRSLAAGVPQA